MTHAMKTMPKYESYKDSGFEWLREIPQNWDIKKVKFLFQLGRGRVISQKELDDDGIYPVYSSQTKNDGILGYISSYDFDCDQITWTTDGANAGTVFLRKEKHNCTNVCGTLRPVSYDKLDMIYISHSLSVSAQFYKRPDTNGAKIMNGEMANVFVVFPPIEEQKAIAKFLDEKTAQIDQAIGIKEQQIALLKERKQIIIQNAVTKGLNPNAPMKDSGVEWIGDIPAHWDVERFCNIFKFGKGLSITKENLQDAGVPCVNYGEIHSKYGFEVCANKHELKCVDTDYLRTSTKSLLRQGDFIFADTSEDLEGSGNFTYISGERDLFAGYHTITARLSVQANSRFLAYLFSSEGHRNQIRQKVKGVKVYSITQSILKDVKAILPPLKEQSEIVTLLDVEIAKIDNAAKLQKAQIDKLKEYKASLINSAVTGKIKVMEEKI